MTAIINGVYPKGSTVHVDTLNDDGTVHLEITPTGNTILDQDGAIALGAAITFMYGGEIKGAM